MFSKKTKNYHKTKLESYLTGVIFSLIFLSGFLLWQRAEAADHYIRPSSSNDATLGCDYNGDGTSWSCAESAGAAGALNDIPATFTRGDTYYFSSGTYGVSGLTIYNTNTSESQWIYWKKATIANNNGNSGWVESLGTGQAIFPNFRPSFQTSYWDIDGVMGSGTDKTSYGFYFYYTESYCNASTGGLETIMIPSSASAVNPSHYRIKHIAFDGCDTEAAGGNDVACTIFIKSQQNISNPDVYSSDIVISNNYFGSKNQDSIFLMASAAPIIEHNYFMGGTGNHDHCHPEQINFRGVDSAVIRYNYFASWASYALGFHVKSAGDTTYSNIDTYVYNNIFDNTVPSSLGIVATIASADSASDNIMARLYVYNNTFIGRGSDYTNGYEISPGELTDDNYKATILNNIFYNVYNRFYTSYIKIYDYNAYLKYTAGYLPSETHACVDSSASAPFVNTGNLDFSVNATIDTSNLCHTIDAGVDGSAVVTTLDDYIGNIRPHNSLWDIGAYEYVGASDVVAPAAPSGLAVS